MAGYTRQSTADIIPTATVRAAPLNAEYNAIRDAFSASGGHRHDGTAAEGDYVPLISDLDNYNKVVIDSTNNRVGVFVEVSAAAVEQVRFQDGAIVPVTTNDINLGTSSLKFKDLYLEGTATIGNISLDGGTIDDTVIGGTTPAAATFTTMTATTVDINGGAIDGTTIGATVAAAADFTTMDASGNATVGGTFGVTGNTTIGGTLGVTGVTTLGTANITSVDLDSGAIDNTTIGAATPATGTFTTLTANTSLTAATADINGGTIDGATIGATSHTTGKFTTLQSTGLATLASVDINGGAIDGATIGASSAAAGSFTTVSTSGQATLATADINGGTIDGTTIGTTTPAAITGTTVTATSFVGPVTGNITGNVTGNVTGDLTGDVTGNITSTGSSSFNNVTIDGTLNMNAGTTATITNLTSPTNTNDAATKGYVDTSISNLVDSAPGTLDTLNELAAALGDDPNFSTTITNSIATKLPLAGGTMTGAIAMSTNKITGLGDPTAAQDAATKNYVDTNALLLSGGTMTGDINMGGSTQLTNLPSPTLGGQAANKTYVDSILGSATAASASAAAAATSESNAATSETNAATSASNAATSESNTATLYDNFDDRYLGAKASAPTLDNDGDALITGALYFNTTTNIMNVYGTSGWQSAGSAVNGTSDRQTYTATSGQTVFAATYDTGYVDVYLNGVKLLAGTDFTATNGTSITLASGAAVNDIVDIVAYGTFVLADHYSKTQSDARYVEVAGDTMTGDLDIQGTLTSDGLTVNSGTANQVATFSSTDAGAFVYIQDDNALGYYHGASNGQYVIRDTDNKSRIVVGSGGDISFYEDTGTTAKFFWDASVESLGIGTSSPSATLTVSQGGNNIFAVERTGVGSGSGQFGINIESDSQTTLSYDDGAPLVIGTASNPSTHVGFSERMRIDSSGNLLVGTTSVQNQTGTTQGTSLYGNMLTVGRATGASAGPVVRLNSIGSGSDEIIDFRKDGTSVGSIDSSSGNLLIRTEGNKSGIRFDTNGITPFKNGSEANGTVDLGYSGGRFKDLYLSGTAYVDTAVEIHAGNSLKMQNVAGNGFATIQNAGAGTNTDLGFSTAGSERMRISSTGKIGINNTSPVEDLHIKGTNPRINVEGDGSSYYPSIRVTGVNGGISLGTYYGGNISGNTLSFLTGDNTTDGGTRRMYINSVGRVGIGTTTIDAQLNIETAANVTQPFAINDSSNTAGQTHRIAFRTGGTEVGTIKSTNSGTSYNTTSDYRLKENVTDVTDGITRVKQLAPKRFNFIVSPDITVDGFIAHEVQDVIPEAISGTKDAMRDEEYEVTPAVLDEDGNVVTEAVMGTRSVPDYQGIDQSKLVPLLTAALQEAIAKIEDLEARVAALET